MTQPSTRINFHFLVSFKLSDRKKLKAFIIALFHKENHSLSELSFVFCNDGYLLGLNRKFLNHDFYTDILTFPFSTPKSREISGEIYISVDRVRENAKDQEIPFPLEMHRVIFHGALHLCHYKDKSEKEEALMRSKEDEYLNLYFPYCST